MDFLNEMACMENPVRYDFTGFFIAPKEGFRGLFRKLSTNSAKSMQAL
ncbi:hypothetical protein [Salinimicrobium marinum]|nr:hypothetical protein [Salinimicrobium marinum]